MPTSKATSKRKGKAYSIGEEIFSSISHGIGTGLSIAALILLIVFAHFSSLKIASAIIYGVTLITLYLCSTLYHSISVPRAKKVFKVLDHCAIYLLIAGTYTPFTLVGINSRIGFIIFAGVWLCAILGIVLNAVDLNKFKKVSMFLYIAMGWCIVFAYKPLSAVLKPYGLVFLLVGGAMYTLGIIFYALKSKMYTHSVWHLFVLAGSVFHFFSILSLYI